MSALWLLLRAAVGGVALMSSTGAVAAAGATAAGAGATAGAAAVAGRVVFDLFLNTIAVALHPDDHRHTKQARYQNTTKHCPRVNPAASDTRRWPQQSHTHTLPAA